MLDHQAIVAHSPIVAGTWAYDPEIRQYPHDPETAAALLDTAGWTPSLATGRRLNNVQPLAFTLLVSTDPVQTAVAEELSRQWSELGIDVTVVTTSPLGLRDALGQRNFEAALVEIALPGDPDPYPLWHQTQITVGQNYAGLDHRQISEIIETARIITNRAQRTDLYRQFQTLFADEVPAIPLYHPIYTYGVDAKVKRVQIGPLMTPTDRFSTIHQWYTVTRQVIVSRHAGSQEE